VCGGLSEEEGTSGAEDAVRGLKEGIVGSDGDINGDGGQEGEFQQEGEERGLDAEFSKQSGVGVDEFLGRGTVQELGSKASLHLDHLVWLGGVPLVGLESRGQHEECCHGSEYKGWESRKRGPLLVA